MFVHSVLLGQNQNISNGIVFDGEPFLAINPDNSQHMVVAWMGWIDVVDRFKIKTRTSFDGGETWSMTSELPHAVAGYSSADPCISFNHSGEVYISYIDFTGTTPPVTGAVFVVRSTDGGLNWNVPSEVISTNDDGTKWPIDRPWMAIDRSSGPHQGTIYVTTFNLNRTLPPYNPYLSVSTDGGNTFSYRYMDTTAWLAGSINPFPMCSPTVSSAGIFFGAYPSYVLSQSLFTQSFLAVSVDGGASLNHSNIITFNPPSQIDAYPDAKKAGLLLSDPSDPDHLVSVFLSAVLGDLDVYMIESMDTGSTWSTPLRVNDDPVSNDRMQDLLWGDFDEDGDLVISWRDRRNASDSTYQTDTEIWGAFRDKDSTLFASNFQLTDQSVTYDPVLANAGNDFMCIALQNDTMSAVWGDTRDGELNIWFQRMTTDGTVVSVRPLASEIGPTIQLFPNPTRSELTIRGEDILGIRIYNGNGQQVFDRSYEYSQQQAQLSIEDLPGGIYFIHVSSKYGDTIQRITKY